MAGQIKIGAGIALDGEREFKSAIQGINKDLNVLGSEMRKVTSEFGANTNSIDALKAKTDVYNRQIDEQKKKVETLTNALEKAKEEYGENSNKVKDWQIQLNNAEGQLNKTETALQATKQQIKDYSEEAKKAAWQTQDFKEKAEKMGESLKNAGDKISGVGKKMSMAITAPLGAAGAASFKFAADLQDAMGATEQIFKGASDVVKEWADNLSSEYGIAEGEALSYANTMGAMLQNIGGLSEREASKQAQTLVELAGDLAAMFGGSTETAVQALTGALKGNNAMLDNYGMGVNDATIKTKALEMGLHNGTGALSLQAKQAATLALIMEQTADAQGQAGRESEGASGSMRALQAELKNLSTDIGEILLPVITPLIGNLRDMIEGFGKLSPETQKTILVVAGLAAAIGPLLIVIGGAISAIGTITTALPVLGAAFTVLTGPVGIAVAAIAAAVAIGVALWKNWDTIKEKAQLLIDKVSEIFSGLKDKMFEVGKNIVEGMWDGIKSMIEWVRTKISNFVGGIVDGVNFILGNHSPSKVFAGIGKNMALGLGEGFENSINSVAKNITKSIQIPSVGYNLDAQSAPSVMGMLPRTFGQAKAESINVTLQIDGQTLARQTFEHFRKETKLRGTPLVQGV